MTTFLNISAIIGLVTAITIIVLFCYVTYLIRAKSKRRIYGLIAAICNLILALLSTVRTVAKKGQQDYGTTYATWIFVWISAYFTVTAVAERVFLVIQKDSLRKHLRRAVMIINGIYSLACLGYTLYLTSKMDFAEGPKFPVFMGYSFIFIFTLILLLHVSFLLYGYYFLVPNEQKLMKGGSLITFLFNSSLICSIVTGTSFCACVLVMVLLTDSYYYAPAGVVCVSIGILLEYVADHLIFIRDYTAPGKRYGTITSNVSGRSTGKYPSEIHSNNLP